MWFIGVEVEQETSAPPPKKNPGSAPEKYIFFTNIFVGSFLCIISIVFAKMSIINENQHNYCHKFRHMYGGSEGSHMQIKNVAAN